MLTSLIQANSHKIIYPHNPNTSEEEMITENLPSSLLIFVIFKFFFYIQYFFFFFGILKRIFYSFCYIHTKIKNFLCIRTAVDSDGLFYIFHDRFFRASFYIFVLLKFYSVYLLIYILICFMYIYYFFYIYFIDLYFLFFYYIIFLLFFSIYDV